MTDDERAIADLRAVVELAVLTEDRTLDEQCALVRVARAADADGSYLERAVVASWRPDDDQLERIAAKMRDHGGGLFLADLAPAATVVESSLLNDTGEPMG